jgi:hypothetical protein
MSRQTAQLVAAIFAAIGTVFFLALAFDILPKNYALFGGVACFSLSGGAYAWAARSRNP